MTPEEDVSGEGPRVVLVTGASSGIGLATARRFAVLGDHVVLLARDEAALRSAAAWCDAAGAASTLVLPVDVGDDGGVLRAVAAVRERYARLDVVVSCAGVVAYGRTEEVPAEVFDGVLRTNLNGSVNLARHVVPVLREQGERGSGTLLLVGSVVGHVTVPMMSAYVLSKWGVRALARQLRLENRDRPGVRVAYVAPGGVDTPVYGEAASTLGYLGRPPPPVASAARTARQVERRTRPRGRWRGRGREQLTWANDVIRFGHTAMPGVYAALVGPLFDRIAVDRSREVGPTPGNVLAPGTHAEEGLPAG